MGFRLKKIPWLWLFLPWLPLLIIQENSMVSQIFAMVLLIDNSRKFYGFANFCYGFAYWYFQKMPSSRLLGWIRLVIIGNFAIVSLIRMDSSIRQDRVLLLRKDASATFATRRHTA